MPTIEQIYRWKLDSDPYRDIAVRMPDLRRLAMQCEVVVEFGVRSGNSTASFLAGGARVFSYDVNAPSFVTPSDCADRWTFTQQDTQTLESIPGCDLLFFDSYHTKEQVDAELRMAKYAKKYLVFHDVVQAGVRGEGGAKGILFAILDFLGNHWSEWVISEFWCDPQGLLVLKHT